MRLKDCRRFAPALFLAGAWFTYPALWIGGSCFAEFRLFGHAALALAAILLLTLDPERLRRFFAPLRPQRAKNGAGGENGGGAAEKKVYNGRAADGEGKAAARHARRALP